jgi:serine/threonine-protein kinase
MTTPSPPPDFESGSAVEIDGFGQFTVEEIVQARPLATRYRVVRGSFQRRYWMDAVQRVTRDRLATTLAPNMAHVFELAHENILPLDGLSQTIGPEPVPVLLMATAGTSLTELQLPREETLSFAAHLGLGVLSALEELHEGGFVHDDVRPDSIFVRLRDGGSSRVVLGLRIERMLGATAPDPSYCAPERLRGEKATPRSDLYSIGAVLYELLSGRRLFPDEHRRRAALEAKTTSLTELAPALHRGLADAVMSALEPDPEARPIDADTFAEALRALILDIEGSALESVLRGDARA